MANTLKLSLPLLASNQAQKDVTVNQALTQLDALVQLSIISRVIATPPATPSNEDAYIIPSGATGAWTSQTNNIAIFLNSTGGWVFVTPQSGWLLWSPTDAAFLVFLSGAWQTVAVMSGVKGSFTLATNTTSTTVTSAPCLTTSVVTVTAKTQDAANDATDLSIVPGNGQFVVTHASNARTDRTFNYMLFV